MIRLNRPLNFETAPLGACQNLNGFCCVTETFCHDIRTNETMTELVETPVEDIEQVAYVATNKCAHLAVRR